MKRLASLTCNEIWLVPVDEQVQRVQSIYCEEFPMISDDLNQIVVPVMVEGAALMPSLLAPIVDNLSRVVWIVPSADFQRKHYANREWAAGIVESCSDPTQAYKNWMQRDIAFARHIHKSAEALGFCVLVVDGSKSLDEMISLVAAHFGLRVP